MIISLTLFIRYYFFVVDVKGLESCSYI